MKKLFYKLWAKFLTQFGAIKIFKFPMFFVYDPSEYEIDGEHMQEALKVLQPGDVILRGYNHYIDGYFVDDPYRYSHGAIYIGGDKIIHAVAEGVSEIHAIDFMKCDRICILRPSNFKNEAIQQAKKFLEENVPYDFSFNYGNSALYCFELCALCYSKLDIQQFEVKKFLGLVKKMVYLADSFRKNQNFKIIFEYNKKFNIDTMNQEKTK